VITDRPRRGLPVQAVEACSRRNREGSRSDRVAASSLVAQGVFYAYWYPC
jgi:hypothetical protein